MAIMKEGVRLQMEKKERSREMRSVAEEKRNCRLEVELRGRYVQSAGNVQFLLKVVDFELATESTLSTVYNVEETIVVLVLHVGLRHLGTLNTESAVDVDEDALGGVDLDSLADDIHKLSDCQIGWYQVLLLVNVGDVTVGGLLANDL